VLVVLSLEEPGRRLPALLIDVDLSTFESFGAGLRFPGGQVSFVVTLVHGTWAGRRKWTLEGVG
jgi:hypothetical protein